MKRLIQLCLLFRCVVVGFRGGDADGKGNKMRYPIMYDHVSLAARYSIFAQHRFAATPEGKSPIYQKDREVVNQGYDVYNDQNKEKHPFIHPKPMIQSQRGFGDDATGFEMNVDAFRSFIEQGAFTTAYLHNCASEKPPHSHIDIYSIVNAPTEPYEVPCLVCSPSEAVSDGAVKAFHIIPDRNPFRPFLSRQEKFTTNGRSTVAAFLFDWYLNDQRRNMRPLYASHERKFMPDFQIPQYQAFIKHHVEDGRIPVTVREEAFFVAERQRQDAFPARKSTLPKSKSAGATDLTFDWPDGRLFVDPNPTGSGTFVHHWNAASSVCVRHANRRLVEPSVVVNVDTLVRPEVMAASEELARQRFTNKHFSQKDEEKLGKVARFVWKLKDLVPKPKDNSKIKASWCGLETDVHWEPWSCCSSCCCKSVNECGDEDNFVMKCDTLPSKRRRKGYCVIKKQNPNSQYDLFSANCPFTPPTVTPDDKIPFYHRGTFAEQKRLMNAYLSTEPYRSQGIPCYSTLIQHPTMKDVYNLLKQNLLPKYEKKHSIGLFVDVKDCTLIEKQDCKEFHRCHKHRTRTFGTKAAVNRVTTCKSFRRITLRNKADQEEDVSENENILLAMEIDDSNKHRVVDEVLWKINGKLITKRMLTTTPCTKQPIGTHIFMTPNHELAIPSIVLADVSVKNDKDEYVPKLFTASSGSILNPVERSVKLIMSSADEESAELVRKLCIYGGIVAVLVVVFVVSACVLKVITKKSKETMEMAKKAARDKPDVTIGVQLARMKRAGGGIDESSKTSGQKSLNAGKGGTPRNVRAAKVKRAAAMQTDERKAVMDEMRAKRHEQEKLAALKRGEAPPPSLKEDE